MTMRELAKLANVSVSTVSKAFCEADDVSEETKQHIFKIAKEQGCYGKFYKGKYYKKIVAIIYPELVSNYYTSYVERLESILAKNDCIAVISVCHHGAEKQAELIEYYASYLKVDGIIVLGLRCQLKKGYKTPIVSLFSAKDNPVDSVKVDYQAAVVEAVRCLREYGHRDIAFLGENLTRRREGYFQNAVKELGMEASFVYMSEYRFEEAGVDGVRRLLDSKKKCTALICAYDNIAYGAIKELQYHGYQVPEDFSVVGIDNIHLSQFIEPTLSSIGPNADEVCMIVWDLLRRKMENQYLYSKQLIVIQGKLFVRDSIARLK